MQNKFSLILQKINSLFLRYPLVLLMSLAMAVTIIYAIETEVKKEAGFICLKLGIVFSLGISLMFALKILSQRVKKGFLWEIIGLVFLVGFYFVLPKKEDDFNEVYAFLIVPSFILSHLLVAFVAFLKNENSEKNFWQYNKNLFVNFFLTIIFTGVLTGGIELAVVAVENLFSFDFDNKIYPEIFVFFSVFGSTLIFLLFNEDGLEYLEKDGNYPVVLKFFTQFILIPLLIIYVVILYFYSAKILINWELPRGWVSYLVLAYSLVGILALLLVHPLKEDTAKSWVKIFSKAFYFTLIPLIVLLFTAIFTRVLQYGYTEARYFVLLIALWLSAVVLYFIFNKRATIKFIPVSLFLFGLFALVFPYFNTFSVAKRSQKNELEKILIENDLLVNGKIDFNKQVVDTVAYEIGGKFNFLIKRFEKDYIEKFLDDKTKKVVAENDFWNWDLFKNIKYIGHISSYQYVSLNAKNDLYEVKDYDYVAILNDYFTEKEIKTNQDTFIIQKTFGNKKTEFTLKLNEEKSVDLIPEIEKLFEKHKGNADKNRFNVDNLFVEADFQKYHIKIVFSNISRSEYKTSTIEYNFNSPVLLIKEK
ncbi:MAG: DUF4153 domain-containing protein [Flavobacteriaceae bacterium]|jgi:hypothetical protein|nr:DUF4153 domain-containing protein [Flavobacteriaceae bacterium]